MNAHWKQSAVHFCTTVTSVHSLLKLKLEEMKVRAMQEQSVGNDLEGKWIRLRVCFDSFSGKI